MKNLLHVVSVSFSIPYFLGYQLAYFAEKGYSESLICSPSDELATFSARYGFKYKTVPILRKFSVWTDLRAIKDIAGYIKSNHIQVVTGHSPKGALLSMIAAYLTRVPMRIYFRHGLVYETSTGLKRTILMMVERLTAKLSTTVVCVSPSLAGKSIHDHLNISRKQIILSKGTCNGIDTNRFHKERIDAAALAAVKNKCGLGSAEFVIGFSGRLVKDKGIIELVDAFTALQKKYPMIRLLLVGMLDDRDALPVEVVDSIEKNAAIIITGYVENAIIETYYGVMNLFVLPSYREGFPTSILEASSMEIPVITTRVTGCVDAIVEGETGLFVDHTPESMEQTIEFLYHNKKLCAEYGKNGRRFVEENFKQEMIWKAIEKLYAD
jgi:glycosyltransferase involved in cell wall biosynthesis